MSTKRIYKTGSPLAIYGDRTTMDAGVGPISLHLFAIRRDEDGEIEAEISMHLSLPEVEDLIIRLKQKLISCHQSGVEKL
ncbi:hypothetical protein LCGC14_2036850 [marine sediment metagenome]|uniref:Uncharacterized protein n=1 Tax=marine sediment metagenome TaxID=412755 RepID=A0A0F9ET05_9ZZZZ